MNSFTSADVAEWNKRASLNPTERANWVKYANASLEEHGDRDEAGAYANELIERDRRKAVKANRGRRNPDEDIRQLERRVEAGDRFGDRDREAFLRLMNEFRRRGDTRWIEMWLVSQVSLEDHAPVDDFRAIVGAVAKEEMPWAWLYASPPVNTAKDKKLREKEEIDRLVEGALRGPDADISDLLKPKGRHDRWIFALAVRRKDGSVTLGVAERVVGTMGITYGDSLDISRWSLSRIWPELEIKRLAGHVGLEESWSSKKHYDYHDAGRPYLPSGAENVSAREGGYKQDEDPMTGARLPHTKKGSSLSKFVAWADRESSNRITLSKAEAFAFAGPYPQWHPKKVENRRKNSEDESLREALRAVNANIEDLDAWCDLTKLARRLRVKVVVRPEPGAGLQRSGYDVTYGPDGDFCYYYDIFEGRPTTSHPEHFVTFFPQGSAVTIEVPGQTRLAKRQADYAWAEAELERVAADFDYADNFRLARVDNEDELLTFDAAKEKGCCGSNEWEVVDPEGTRWLLGFNYGH